jgi:hypothetical protein
LQRIDPSGLDTLVIGIEGTGAYNFLTPKGKKGLLTANLTWQNFLKPFDGMDKVHIQYHSQSSTGFFGLNTLADSIAKKLKTPRAWEYKQGNETKILTAEELVAFNLSSSILGGLSYLLCKPVYDRVAIVGWSWGANGAVRLAEALNARNIRVDVLFTIDPVIKGPDVLDLGPLNANVVAGGFTNYYQRVDLITGFFLPIRGRAVEGAANTQLSKNDFNVFGEMAWINAHMFIMGLPQVKNDWSDQLNGLIGSPYRDKKLAFI